MFVWYGIVTNSPINSHWFMTLIGTTWLVQAVEFLADLRERTHRNMVCLTVDCKSHAVWIFLADVYCED